MQWVLLPIDYVEIPGLSLHFCHVVFFLKHCESPASSASPIGLWIWWLVSAAVLQQNKPNKQKEQTNDLLLPVKHLGSWRAALFILSVVAGRPSAWAPTHISSCHCHPEWTSLQRLRRLADERQQEGKSTQGTYWELLLDLHIALLGWSQMRNWQQLGTLYVVRVEDDRRHPWGEWVSTYDHTPNSRDEAQKRTLVTQELPASIIIIILETLIMHWLRFQAVMPDCCIWIPGQPFLG